jgi:pyruvate ferredoxin oxidoreductase beta subunit
VRVARLAVETGMWVLYEVDHGRFSLTGPSKNLVDKNKRKPVREYLKLQGRFAHLKDEDVEEIQRLVDAQWESIVRLLKEQQRQRDS